MLERLDEADARSVIAAGRRRKFRRSEAIMREGDSGDTLHLIDRGHVAVRVTTPAGDTATMRVLGPGGNFGEIAVFESSYRSATVVALNPVETLSYTRDGFNRLRVQFPAIDHTVMFAALGEVRRLTNALTEALYLPVPRRLARNVERLLAIFDNGVIPLTQDDIAGLSGTTRQTANEVLKALVADGAIEVARGRITVVDAIKLARAAR